MRRIAIERRAHHQQGFGEAALHRLHVDSEAISDFPESQIIEAVEPKHHAR
jgi:hypothetical protein